MSLIDPKMPYKNDLWYTSPWNFDENNKKLFHFADNIQIHDVTLRDGEQQNGVVFNVKQKVELAEKMAEIGIDRIEAGFAAVTPQDEEAIREICKHKFGPKIFTFARCMIQDLDLVKDMGCDGVCLEIPANEELIQYGYKWDTQKAIDNAIKASLYAHEIGLFSCLFCLDSSRADWNYLTKFIDAIYKDGYFDSIACVDTVGALNPLGSYAMVQAMKSRYPDKIIEFHAHDDFCTGSANTVMALAAGAQVAHTSLAGIGERAGNVSFEEVVMQLLLTYGVELDIKYNKLYDLARLTLDMAGYDVRPNKGIFGTDISKLETGLAAGWLENLKKEGKSPLLMIPYLYKLTGHPDTTYSLGKHSGAPSVQFYLNQLGYKDVDKETVGVILKSVKEKAYEIKNVLTLEQFQELVEKALKK